MSRDMVKEALEEQEEASENISNILARQRHKETQKAMLKKIMGEKWE